VYQLVTAQTLGEGETPDATTIKPSSTAAPPTDSPQPRHGSADRVTVYAGKIGCRHEPPGRRVTSRT